MKWHPAYNYRLLASLGSPFITCCSSTEIFVLLEIFTCSSCSSKLYTYSVPLCSSSLSSSSVISCSAFNFNLRQNLLKEGFSDLLNLMFLIYIHLFCGTQYGCIFFSSLLIWLMSLPAECGLYETWEHTYFPKHFITRLVLSNPWYLSNYLFNNLI